MSVTFGIGVNFQQQIVHELIYTVGTIQIPTLKPRLKLQTLFDSGGYFTLLP